MSYTRTAWLLLCPWTDPASLLSRQGVAACLIALVAVCQAACETSCDPPDNSQIYDASGELDFYADGTLSLFFLMWWWLPLFSSQCAFHPICMHSR